ncbi:two-component system sensor histidine kinase NtrB [Melittangium boletus]|uniref:sensor histidine kinase n=1 Tax=Melittangium boletus TaxID=83453 RepID=UPI003DA378C4
MTTQAWLSLGACAGLLALAVLALVRVGRSPLALPLAVLCITLSTWNFADFALANSGGAGWRIIATVSTMMSAPPLLHFLLAFVGERRRLSGVMYATYGLFGALSLVALGGLGTERVAAGVTSRGFTWVLVGLFLPVLGTAFWLLGRHLRREPRAIERMRTRLLLTGLALLVLLFGTDVAAELGGNVPRLGGLGTLLGLPAIAVVALRLRLFGQELTNVHAAYALLLSLIGVLSYLGVFRAFAERRGALVVGTVAITLALLGITRRGVSAFVAQRERLTQMATLGRFSAQMAHDLKNPIAALKGATQYLQEEHARGQPWDDKGEFLDLLLEQVERLDRVVDTYQRLGRVEPLVQPVDLNQLATSVLSLQGLTGRPAVELRQELAPGALQCAGDWDLLVNAVENLVRNALEAMPNGGTLTVRTRREVRSVVLGVEDTGEGMNARTRERAFDDFYTTKATGSGLGLAFVRRVVESHGGRVKLTSHEGRGTTVTLRLPVSGPGPER